MQLAESDDLSSVREKLEQARSGRVALLVPRGNMALRSEVQLSLVRRVAEALAIDLVLVAGDRAIAEAARGAGLRVVASAGGAQHVRSRRLSGLQARLWQGMSATPPRPGLEVPARGTTLRLDRPGQKLAVSAAGLGALLLVVLGLLVLLPSATVLLNPIGEAAHAEAEVVARTDLSEVDYQAGQVPARLVKIEVGGDEAGQTTGKQTLPDQHATGEVVFANKTTSEVQVPKGTVVRTTDGVPVKFYTLLDAKVPGSYGATVRVPIMAFEPGPVGNVGALTIREVEGEPGYGVDVLNDKATQGGKDRRVSIVAAQDLDRLRASLMQRLQQEAYDKLVAQLNQREWIPPDSLDVQVVEETFDKKLDEQAETLHLTMKVQVTGIAVEGEGTRALMMRRLESQGSKGLIVNEATLQVQQPVGSASVEGKAVRFRAAADALLVPAIDLGAVSRRIAGQEPTRAADMLAEEYQLRQAPEIAVKPSWWPRLPWLAGQIHVQLAGGR